MARPRNSFGEKGTFKTSRSGYGLLCMSLVDGDNGPEAARDSLDTRSFYTNAKEIPRKLVVGKGAARSSRGI